MKRLCICGIFSCANIHKLLFTDFYPPVVCVILL